MKKVYLSFFLHGNMCYDRYTKQEIREKFPLIYASGIRAMHEHPQVTAHIDFPGLTTLSLKHHVPWFMDELQPLVDRGQVVMVGCQYAASHAMCSDEESDRVAGAVSMAIMRDELQPDVATFFNQEMPFHPQEPFIMRQIGVRWLLSGPDWGRPKWVEGLDGSRIIVCPLSAQRRGVKRLEDVYDLYDDGDLVIMGGDFELLGNIPEMVAELAKLAERGKVIEWTTVPRYEEQFGIDEVVPAPSPFRLWREDLPESPSFSRWVSNPEDPIWHGHAVEAMDAIRTAGFAAVCARLYDLGAVDVPLTEAWTTPPDNPWDYYFEHADEYPETEPKYLSLTGEPTLFSRAWHHLLIGLNSDASGWKPWQPRTRHREIVLQASKALSQEVVQRFAHQVSARLTPPSQDVAGHVLALNPMPARTVEISRSTERPMVWVDTDGTPIPTITRLEGGQWSARARVALPAYGYKRVGLASTSEVDTARWQEGDAVTMNDLAASLANGRLTIRRGEDALEVTVPAFQLFDPTGVAESEEVTPDWSAARTRVRRTALGPDLEVMTELAWTVWLRLVISLRDDRVEVRADVYVDRPRLIGPLGYEPRGLRLAFRGQPGRIYYDIPYATIQHPNEASSFVAAQRFVALEGEGTRVGLIALGGNQSFEVAANEGLLAVGLGASTQGRPDTRPECIIRADGTAEHHIVTEGDPLFGEYTHRVALVFGDQSEVAQAARRLRTAVPLVDVGPGAGDWPAEGSLLHIAPDTAWVTAFRVTREGYEVVVNNVSGAAGTVEWEVPERTPRRSESLGAYGVKTLDLGI